jgi:molecular chaperone HtpG
MTSKKGSISVNTQDILPIIKKWLYSEHDIFIRELVANATDAITKRAAKARVLNQEIPSGSITVSLNKTDKTIKVMDNGIGMTGEEIVKYITQVAFSGAEEFVKNMKEAGADNKNDIIGKFGLGFYSSFMVAHKVEIETLSMQENAQAQHWTSEGDSEYLLADGSRKEVGTTITLHLNEDAVEFLDAYKMESTLRKYCDFMLYPIGVLDEEKKLEKDQTNEPTIINESLPIWKKSPTDLKDEDYIEFYRQKFPMEGEPLFWIHLNVDHPFTLNGVLFFPKLNPNKPFQESNIKLYARQVFVTDNVKNIVPEFLALLRGYIDSPDIPLNVSRSSLQGDPNIRKISNYIVKKVAESLKKLWNNDRTKYENIWNDSGLFIKYGCVSDSKFDELMRDKIIFKNSESKFFTLDELRSSYPAKYQDKLKEKVVYFEKGKSDPTLRKQLLDEGVHTIEVDEYIDPHFMQHVESQKAGDHAYRFSSVDSSISEILESETTTEEDVKIKDLFQMILQGNSEEKKEEATPKLDGFEIEIQKFKNAKAPAYFKVDEQMKRFQKMTASMGSNVFPLKKTLVINPGNSLIQNAFKLHQRGDKKELVEKICHHVESLAHISSEGLKNEDRELFVQRSQELIQQLTDLHL